MSKLLTQLIRFLAFYRHTLIVVCWNYSKLQIKLSVNLDMKLGNRMCGDGKRGPGYKKKKKKNMQADSIHLKMET